jgi:outer membrane protein assembly factor BamB
VEALWKNRNLRTRFTSAVFHEGHFYGLNEGILECVAAADGRRIWKDGRYGHGQLLLVDGNLLILAESGKLALVEATPDGYRELTSFPALRGEKTWNTPALADGIAYLRNHQEMAAYDLRDHRDDSLLDPPFAPPSSRPKSKDKQKGFVPK